jgi:hypothetical protein
MHLATFSIHTPFVQAYTYPKYPVVLCLALHHIVNPLETPIHLLQLFSNTLYSTLYKEDVIQSRFCPTSRSTYCIHYSLFDTSAKYG